MNNHPSTRYAHLDNFIPPGQLLVASAWSVGGPAGEGRWPDPGRANACGLRIQPSFFLGGVVDRGHIAQRMNHGRAPGQIVFWGICVGSEACSTNDVLALLHHSFEYPLHSEDEDESESLEHIEAYASQTPFVNDGLPAHGYGVLSQPIVQTHSQSQSQSQSPSQLQLQSQSQSPSQSHSHSIPWSGAKGLRYPSAPAIQDGPPFQSLSGLPMSPLDSSICGSTSTSPASALSPFVFSPHVNYSLNGSHTIGSYSSPASVAYTPALNYTPAYLPTMYHGRTRVPTIPSSSGMPSPLQSPGNPNAVSTSHGTTAAESYSTPSSHLHSYAYSHGAPSFLPPSSQQSLIATSRGFGPSMTALSSSTSGSYSLSSSAMQFDPSSHYQLAAHIVPPFERTQIFVPIIDAKGSQVVPELHAKIDKGFFKADQDWTCYRRNYFSVASSYSLKPTYIPGSDSLYIQRSNGNSTEAVTALAICITARVSGDDAKPIDLVQHTPKRDKGPLGRPQKIKLMPCASGSSGVYSEPSGPSPSSQLSPDYDSSYAASSPSSPQNPTLASFDRIQFKNATANNGKRRAAQQYFNIVVELFAQVSGGQSSEIQWTKVASRTSAPMVVRGRSPGHYQDDRRGSSTNMGPGSGSGGDSASGPRDPTANGTSGPSRSGLSVMPFSSSSRLGGSAYMSHHASLDQSPPGSSSSGSSSYNSDPGLATERPDASMPSPEEVTNIEEYDGYQYYPSTLYESAANTFTTRLQLPPIGASVPRAGPDNRSLNHDLSVRLLTRSSGSHDERLEVEKSFKPGHNDHKPAEMGAARYASNSRSWTSASDNFRSAGGRGCGRFQGVDSSLGYYPVTPAL